MTDPRVYRWRHDNASYRLTYEWPEEGPAGMTMTIVCENCGEGDEVLYREMHSRSLPAWGEDSLDHEASAYMKLHPMNLHPAWYEENAVWVYYPCPTCGVFDSAVADDRLDGSQTAAEAALEILRDPPACRACDPGEHALRNGDHFLFDEEFPEA